MYDIDVIYGLMFKRFELEHWKSRDADQVESWKGFVVSGWKLIASVADVERFLLNRCRRMCGDSKKCGKRMN